MQVDDLKHNGKFLEDYAQAQQDGYDHDDEGEPREEIEEDRELRDGLSVVFGDIVESLDC